MNLIDTPHKRKSLIITILLMMVLIGILFFVGLTYLSPPIENGIAIQFGNSIKGSGESTPMESVKKTPKPEPQQTEKILTQQQEEAPSVDTSPQKNKKKLEEKPVKKEQKKEEPKVSKETNDAINQILNASKSSSQKGQGDDTSSEQKGSLDGARYANAFYGNSGTGKSWGLNGRSLVSGGKVIPECNESGRVVVQIEVDRNGKVVKATPGVKGTTNNHPCLMEPARQTALMHRWNVDKNAPERQIGFIEIHFKLSE